MKAAQLTKYAKNYQLELNEIDVPTINDTEVLIKVKEAAVNPLDALIGTGSLRLMHHYQLPQTMGNELTGEIVQLGRSVTQFNLGDSVYTRLPFHQIGAFAQYVAVDASAIAPLPSNLDFKTGAAAALTGLTAYQGLHEILAAKSGQTLFIPGGSGSFGQMAIPIAKALGLTVIVSGNAQAKERTLAAGADQYFDYHTQNYWELLSDVDLVIDTLGPAELEHELSIIKPGGQLLSLIMGPNGAFARAQHMPLLQRILFGLNGRKLDQQAKKAGVTYHFIFVRSDGQQLRAISKLIEANNIVPAVDSKSFDLTEVNEAQAYLANGHPRGKVLIHFDDTVSD
ncbi:alcohol dehydrogenase GroES domain protein [Secundilactobacillus odoratitofui DSM 19909 = JCM 15043]|uniref:Alcohol dehydrogenase GroES domain protein n=1 Tax=Secundilactobacillus odoratitofui DSM 19909 = JCM 15043 TaxID=1423776 RepID=A0A0R1LW59_9LACO|nr:NADP-dependent oxidoreductase [Secundilactobacillus odoratitofui]KRK99839.1 alcohol dehydrogenase GroES domain protein [Secundilactobacillus odoratitofui DSM 19909 = JCM 15043]